MCMRIKTRLILVNLAGGWLNVRRHFDVGRRRRDTSIMPPFIEKLFARGLTPSRFASLLTCSSHYMTLNATVDDRCRTIDYMPCICSMFNVAWENTNNTKQLNFKARHYSNHSLDSHPPPPPQYVDACWSSSSYPYCRGVWWRWTVCGQQHRRAKYSLVSRLFGDAFLFVPF